jgi:hypothetical protein
MEVDYFLKRRTAFIRNYHATAAMPFQTIKQAIEDEVEPYVPPYSEDGEPAFLEEWLNAETGIQIVGRTCVSMLSESLKVYLQTWEKLFRVRCEAHVPEIFKKKGFWHGYKECLCQITQLDWSACPANLVVIEQVVEARNRSQHHGGDIDTLSVRHPKDLREKYDRPIFIYEHEKDLGEEQDRATFKLLGSELIISKDTLDEALRQVESLVDWLEPKLQERRWRRKLGVGK